MQAHLSAELLARGRQLEAQPLVLLTGPGGSGKSTLARAWREDLHSNGGRMAWLVIRALHRDPILFVEDWVEAIRDVLPEPLDGAESFGTSLLRAMPRSGAIEVEPIVRLMRRELKQLASPLSLCLDAFEHLDSDGVSIAIVDALLRLELRDIAWIIASRGLHPGVSARMLAEGKAVEIDAGELSLRTDQVQKVLADAGVELDEGQLEQLLARTEGWPIAIHFAARALSGVAPSERSRFIERLVRERNLFRYIANEIMEGISPETASVLETASILGQIEYATLAKAVEAPGAAERIEEAINLGLLQANGDEVVVHELLADWMRVRLEDRLEPGDWRALHQRLGGLLEELGQGMEALRLYRAADLSDSVAELLSWEGHAWVNGGHYDLTDAALQELPEAVRRSNPALIAVAGIIEGGRDPDTAVDNLKLAIEMYRKAGNQSAEFEAFHELAIVAVNENRMSEVQGIFRHALSLRRVVSDPKLRGMLMLAVAGGTSLFGRFRLSLRLVQLAATYEHAPRERAGITLVRSTIHFYQGQWDRVIAEVDERCADEEQRRHGPGFFAIQTLRCAALGLRGVDIPGCRETLRQASQMFVTAGHRFNRMNAEMAHGQVALYAGDFDSALEHFSESAALARRIQHHTAETASYGLLARTYQRAANSDLAIENAELALAKLEEYKPKDFKGSRAPFWAPAMALGALVHAELVGGERARRALGDLRTVMVHRELPLCEYALRICFGRIDDLAKDTEKCRKNLGEAWHVYRRASLRDRPPEIDQTLWDWSLAAAHKAGIETGFDSTRGGAKDEVEAPACEIRSLGELSVLLAGRPVSDRDWRGKTTRRLLARLLVEDGKLIPRERVEADLWPEANPSSARNSLKVGLSRLRNAMEPRRRKGEASPYIRVEGESLGLTEGALADWDVRGWSAALSELEVATRAQETAQTHAALDRFKKLNRGPFAPEFLEDWSLEFRRVLDERWLQAGRASSQAWIEHGNPELAVSVSSLLVQSHRDDEVAWECLAEAQLRNGDRSGALRTFEEASAALASGFGIEPGDGLKRVEAEIRGLSSK